MKPWIQMLSGVDIFSIIDLIFQMYITSGSHCIVSETMTNKKKCFHQIIPLIHYQESVLSKQIHSLFGTITQEGPPLFTEVLSCFNIAIWYLFISVSLLKRKTYQDLLHQFMREGDFHKDAIKIDWGSH